MEVCLLMYGQGSGMVGRMQMEWLYCIVFAMPFSVSYVSPNPHPIASPHSPHLACVATSFTLFSKVSIELTQNTCPSLLVAIADCLEQPQVLAIPHGSFKLHGHATAGFSSTSIPMVVDLVRCIGNVFGRTSDLFMNKIIIE